MSDEAISTSPLEDALNTLRANPEIIGKIADAIGMEAPENLTAEEKSPLSRNASGGDKKQGKGDGDRSASASPIPENLLDKLPLVLSALGQGGDGGFGKLNLEVLMGDPNKKALLKALCPYLSPTRRETAEGILRLWSVGDILRGL